MSHIMRKTVRYPILSKFDSNWAGNKKSAIVICDLVGTGQLCSVALH